MQSKEANRAGRALLVVEPNFANEHIGVRRVILDYWRRLDTLGYGVDLAVIRDGELFRVTDELCAAIYRSLTSPTRRRQAPRWDSRRSRRVAARSIAWNSNPAGQAADDVSGVCSPREYEVSILSNPWLCNRLMPDVEFTHGIVYDLVPNLLAAQVLDFSAPYLEIAPFAYAHHVGYRYYLDRVKTILCISESTRTDFVRYYSPDSPEKVVVDFPFHFEYFVEPTDDPPPISKTSNRLRVALVNVLDPRKNVEQVCRALSLVSRRIPTDVTVVGRERLPANIVMQYLSKMAEHGAHVTWYRDAQDHRLYRAYQNADVLLFPSLYEGLGLPILESQCLGTPAISGTGSSMGEINLNPLLKVDQTNALELASALELSFKGPVVKGVALSAQTKILLSKNHRFEATLHAARTQEAWG